MTAAPDDDVLKVNRTLRIPVAELAWRFSRSGGPGGQHANTSDTRAEVIFDVEHSPSLGPRQRARLLQKLGPEVRVASAAERSQARNRSRALEHLADTLRKALERPRRRVPTKPSRAAQRRRVEQKRRRGHKKRLRKKPRLDE